MRAYVYPGDQWACGAYRVRWPGHAVNDAGFAHVEVIDPGDRGVKLNVTSDGRVTKETFPEDADVVVMQRPTNSFLSQVIPLLRERGVAVVVDMDDDLSCIHPKNPAFAALAPKIRHPQTGRMVRNFHSFANAQQACRDATLVTVTTPALAQRYGYGNAVVIPNYVPSRYLDAKHEDSDVIGWGGSVHSHPDDLQAVGPAIARLVQNGAVFETVGDKEGVARALGLSDEPGGPGPVSLADWPQALARFGIGIAPLAMTRFNASKSLLKPLELSATGVPWVASPTPDYRKLHAQGCGLIAEKPRHWEGMLRSLVNDPARRAEMSEAGREVAAKNTLEGNAWRWAEAWADAVEMQRGAKRKAVAV